MNQELTVVVVTVDIDWQVMGQHVMVKFYPNKFSLLMFLALLRYR